MQTKGLFAALLCGVVCLTGCLENVESESVAEVRKAKAKELISVATLNESQAQAELIKARAEATIAEAQAKLIEAQAAIAQAEALRIAIQAELDAVNVEIAKVKLKSEKVKLQEQKAKLEQTLAEVEAAIAKANLVKETALIQLEKAQKQAEIDKINMQKKLIAAEQEMLKQAEKMDAEVAKALKDAWRKYSDAMDKYYSATADLMKTEAQIATMQNNMTAGLAVMSAKVQSLEEHLEKLNAEIEYLRSFEVVTPDKYDIMHAEALEGLEAAYTKKQLAEDNYELIQSYYDAYEAMFTPGEEGDQLAYIINWQDNFIRPLRTQLANLDLEFVADYDENDVPVVGVQVPQTDKLPYFAPLFTGTIGSRGTVRPFYGSFTKVETGEYYPELGEDGIISEYAIPVTKMEFTPAKIYNENISILLGIMDIKAITDGAQKKDELDDRYNAVINGQINKIEPNLEPEKPEYDGSTPGLQETIDSYQAIYDAMKNYVDEANKVLDPAYSQIAMAEGTYKVAQEELRSSVVELVAYNVGLTDFAKYNEAQLITKEAKAEVKAAAKDVRKLSRKIHNLHRALYGVIDEDIEMPEDPTAPDFGPEYGGIISDEGLYTQKAAVDAAIAAQQDIVDALEAEITPAIIQDLTTAENNLKTQIDEVIPAKYEAEREAWIEYQAAYAAWVINPNDETKALKDEKYEAYYGTDTKDGALKELKDAIAETQATEEGDKTLMDAYNKAKAAYDEPYNNYKEEADKLVMAKLIQEQMDGLVLETESELEEAGNKLITAKQALENAKERVVLAQAAEDAAYDKIKWIDDEEPDFDNMPEEQVTLIKNVIAAMKGASDAEKALDKDWDTYLALYEAYNYEVTIPGEEDPIIYNIYEEYTEQLDPDFARLSRYDNPRSKDEWGWHEPVYSRSEGKEPSIAQKLNNAKKHLETVNETYKSEIDAITAAVAQTAKDVADILEAIGKYSNVKDAYLDFGAKTVTAYDAVMDAQEKIIDANMAVDLAEAMFEAVHYVASREIFVGVKEVPGSDPEVKKCTMADIEEIIRFIQTGKYFDEETQKIVDVDPKEFLCINKCKEKIAQLKEAIAMYFVNPEVNAKELNELTAEALSLRKKIEVYNALVEMYATRIAFLTGSNNPE